jgi:glycerol-3-phosphate dehydrogenase (NAD(P)+)
VGGGIGEEAEGVRTAQALFQLAQSLGVDMPITEQVYRVLFEGAAPRVASDELMRRALRSELHVSDDGVPGGAARTE